MYRFGEIAKQAPPTPRIQQQTNVTIPQARRDLFTNKKSATMNIANRLKKVTMKYFSFTLYNRQLFR